MASSSSSHNNDSETLFRRNYAAQLAQAIREAEQSAPISNDELLQETYRQLLFDDPIVQARGCRLLSKAFLDTQQQAHYALSERLVEGIQQVLSKMQHSTTTNNEQQEQDATEQSSSLLLSSLDDSEQSEAAFSILAWTVFGRIPLLCCLADQLNEAAALGSYRGPEILVPSHNEESAEVNQAAEEEAQQQQHEEPNVMNGHVMNGGHDYHNDDDNDSLQEVWAAESDPSDYDYGEQQRLDELDHSDWQPIDLDNISQVPNNTTWKDIAQGITNLVRSLSYTLSLSGLSLHAWKQHKISQHLTQLVLTFLVPTSSSLLFQQYPNSHWQHLGLHVLHVFRDAVLHNHTFLDDYLQLLQTLLQVDAAQDDASNSMAPATSIGLGALGALCSHTTLIESHTSVLKTCILECCDDLTMILEKTTSHGDTATTVAWTFVSILELLAHNNTEKSTTPLTNAQAQILLNSGLFRQWLRWWEQRISTTTTSGVETKRAMQTAIFRLCLSSPTLLGKYAWRVPNLAASMTSSKDNTSLADCILWNLLGMHLMEQVTKSKVQWKTKSGTTIAAAPTCQDCQHSAWTAFQSLCQAVAEILSDWKKRRQEGLDAAGELQNQITTIADFGKLVDGISNKPLLLELFTEKMAPEVDGKSRRATLQTQVQPLQQLLSQWPAAPSTSIVKAKSDDDTPTREAPPQKPHHGEDEAVKALRKSLKVLQSALETTSEAQAFFSSKAD